MDISAAGVLLLLIAVAALPVFLIYLWIRLSRFNFRLLCFLCSLLAGTAALFLALFLQSILPKMRIPPDAGVRWNFFEFFIRIALTEELGRLIILLILLRIFRRLAWDTGAVSGAFTSLTGLVTGLGFAVIESASYGSADMGISLLRAFTSVPLHGACGARVGMAAAGLKQRPIPSVFRFLSAVAIHGMYNLMIVLPGIFSFLAILIALSALASSLVFIRGEMRRENS
jgi:RsiW-degrading membrane proteinase PrsW (M82 family)